MNASKTALPDISSTQGILSVRFEANQTLIRVAGRGFCNEETSDTFLAQLKNAIAVQRRQGPVRVLVDGRGMVTQSAEFVNRMQVETGRLYRDGDRVAVLGRRLITPDTRALRRRV